MVTTTVRMVDRVHSNTTSLWPAVALDSVLVVSSTGLEQWLVDTTTSSNNTDGSTASGGNKLLGTRWETDTGLVVVRVVSNNGSVVARAAGDGASISRLLLNVADDGTFWHGSQRQNITDAEGSYKVCDETRAHA
jgi:hypothetical protein